MYFTGAFSSINKRKEDVHAFFELITSFKSIIDITWKVSSMVTLITSIVFNNSFGTENHIYWTFE